MFVIASAYKSLNDQLKKIFFKWLTLKKSAGLLDGMASTGNCKIASIENFLDILYLNGYLGTWNIATL